MSSTGRLTLLYAALFYELGVNLPFFPVWLRAQSLDDATIGVVLAAPLLARIIANPVVTALADRSGRSNAILLACASLVTVGTAALGWVSGFTAILVVVVLIALAQGPLIALTDSVTLSLLRNAPAGELTYGRIRLWGSLAFAFASFSAGWLLSVLPVSTVIVLLTAAAALTALAAANVPSTPTVAPAHHAAGARGGAIWPLALTVAGAALVQASHAVVYAFSTLQWQDQGIGSTMQGALWSTGIVSEIVLFSLAGRAFKGARGAASLLFVGATASLVRWTGMALEPALPALFALQLLHGLTFGATHLGSVFLLARLSPAGHAAQAQGWLAAAWAGSMAILTSLSGRLTDTWGSGVYLLMAGVAALGLLMLLPVLLRSAWPEPRHRLSTG